MFMNKFRCFLLLLLLPVLGWAQSDPMKPPFFDGSSDKAEVKAARSVKLSMVLIAPGRKVAVIDGKSVTVGDSVSGYRVLRIDEGKVVLSGRGKIKELFLNAKGPGSKTGISGRQMVVEN